MVAGPSNAAAALEGSKTFAKDFMKRHNIQTAEYKICTDLESAKYTHKSGEFQFTMVIKADGLAAGKGVFICNDLSEGLHALQLIMKERKFGSAGDKLVIEEFLEGEEVSFMVFTDGKRIIPMVPSQDHKAICCNLWSATLFSELKRVVLDMHATMYCLWSATNGTVLVWAPPTLLHFSKTV